MEDKYFKTNKTLFVSSSTKYLKITLDLMKDFSLFVLTFFQVCKKYKILEAFVDMKEYGSSWKPSRLTIRYNWVIFQDTVSRGLRIYIWFIRDHSFKLSRFLTLSEIKTKKLVKLWRSLIINDHCRRAVLVLFALATRSTKI